MEQREFKFSFAEFNNREELSSSEQFLLSKAEEASAKAYAPYSKFNVGAAVQLENGKIVTGNNQENAAFPNGMCAERVAIFNAASNYPEEAIVAIAVNYSSEENTFDKVISPCGSCRQSLNEYEVKQDHSIKVILSNPNGTGMVIERASDLLPIPFSF